MPDLIASGTNSTQRWRRPIPEAEVIRIGRAPRNGWAIPWEPQMSREHADLRLENGRLHVRALQTARNPIYFDGQATPEFTVSEGEEFRIGSTSFRLKGDVQVQASQTTPLAEHSYNADELKRFKFRDADQLLEVLLADLPQVISQSQNDGEFADRLVKLLLDAIPRAAAAAVIETGSDHESGAVLSGAEAGEPSVMRYVTRTGKPFRPSRRLIAAALTQGQGVLHIWYPEDENAKAYTISGRMDWAFCIPVSEADGSESVAAVRRTWWLYVCGEFGFQINKQPAVSEEELRSDLRFTEVLAKIVGAVRHVRRLERQQAGLARFFSPAVLETLRNRSEDVLEPRESDITVMFCDLRGFSKKAEVERNDLPALLKRVSAAMGVMHNAIVKYEGVISDFQGDAACGFWGWPLSQPDAPLLACRAALEIRAEFEKAARLPDQPLAGFRVGIGIGHGRAIAGNIGTAEQAKAGVFGPVVNHASRLEGMTKQLQAPILIDGATAEYVRKHLPADQGRCRCLGRVRPYGMENAPLVTELLPPRQSDATLSDQNILDYEAAVDAIREGRWQEALGLFHRLPPTDRAKDFWLLHIARHNYQPPPDWDGVVTLASK